MSITHSRSQSQSRSYQLTAIAIGVITISAITGCSKTKSKEKEITIVECSIDQYLQDNQCTDKIVQTFSNFNNFNLSDIKVGNVGIFDLNTNNGLPITYSSSTPTVCSIEGNTITAIGTGTCAITASQAGNDTTKSITETIEGVITLAIPTCSSGETLNSTKTACIKNSTSSGSGSSGSGSSGSGSSTTPTKATQTITFTLPPLVIGTPKITNFPTTSSANIAVTYASSTPTVCSITTTGDQITAITAGTCTIKANAVGNSTTLPAENTASVTIAKLNQTITLNSIPDLWINDTYTLPEKSSANLNITYTVNNSSIGKCSITGNTVKGLAIGDCEITASQTGNGTYNQATAVSSTIKVKKRYEAYSTNCVKDNKTNRIWEQKTTVNTNDTYSWVNATVVHVKVLNTANYCGYNDWRLPTKHELAGIVDTTATPAPFINSIFTNTNSALYWSATSNASHSHAWYVGFDSNPATYGNKNFSLYVRAVRSDKYVEHNQKCIEDTNTGLIWEQKTDNTTPDIHDKDNTYTWYNSNLATAKQGTATTGTCIGVKGCDTEKYIAALNTAHYCGYNNWRLPTKVELAGIVDTTATPAPLINSIFTNTNSALYWSSSPYSSGSAWSVYFYDGNNYHPYKDDGHYVRAVRSR